MQKLYLLSVLVLCLFLCILFSGCSFRDVSQSLGAYFEKTVQTEEETAEISLEEKIISVGVRRSDGEFVTNASGEPITLPGLYETATGGEERYNARGEQETYPIGQVMTYAAGEPATLADGTIETYSGGEEVTDALGIVQLDDKGSPMTRESGESVTHSEGDLVYDAQGRVVRSTGEPMTYAPGEYMYNAWGERVAFQIQLQTDASGEVLTDTDGTPFFHRIEAATDASGEPVTEENGEAATKVLDPDPPKKIVDQPIPDGSYYIRSSVSAYVYFSTPEVPRNMVMLPEDPEQETITEVESAPEGEPEEVLSDAAAVEGTPVTEDISLIHNLQLEILGENLSSMELRTDPEGYAYFVAEGTEQVLGIDGEVENGANIELQEMEKIPYPQYAYWEDPVFALEDHQRWVLETLEDGSFRIISALDPAYVMTVDNTEGIQSANVLLWQYEEWDQQKFVFETDVPKAETPLEEGTWFIRTGCSAFKLASIGDGHFEEGRGLYVYTADGLDGQQFTISYDQYGLATIAHSDSNMVLSVADGEAFNYQSIVQSEDKGEPWQRWILDPVPDSEAWLIRSAADLDQVMNLKGGNAADLQPVCTYQTDNTNAQRWFFTKEVPQGIFTYDAMLNYAQRFSSMTEYLILINNLTNHVGIYSGYQGNWTCIQYWDCDTGKPSTPTVQGEYTITWRQPSFDGDTDSPAEYTCYYATMFYPQYYFHSVIYYKGTKDIMDATMGYSVSHGCVRLYIENAQWIYENIPDGTKVVSF